MASSVATKQLTEGEVSGAGGGAGASSSGAPCKSGARVGPDGLTVPTIYAHRGACGYHPAHTLSAYEAALEAGADYIEFDVWLICSLYLLCSPR